MNVSYATMEAMGMLVKRLGQDARRLEKALAETMNASAEWKRIADELKAERDAAKQEAASARQDAVTRAEADRKRIDGLMIQVQDMRAEIERLKKPARKHPVAVGEWVECILTDACDQRHPLYRIGSKGRVGRIVERPNYIFEYHVTIGSDQVWWESSYCIPCDPPEATHDTPEGRSVAEATVKREPKPGDTVRLVSVPTCNDYGHAWILEWGAVGNMGKVCKIRSYPFGNVAVVDIDARLSYEWPLSCVEVVRGGDK